MIASLHLQIHLPQSQSLKQKRTVIKSLKDRLRNKFNISVAEVGELGKWQLCDLELVMTSNDQSHMQEQIQKINDFVDQVLAGDGFVTSREMSMH